MKFVKASEQKLENDKTAIVRWYQGGMFERIDLMSGHYLYDWAAKNNHGLETIEWLDESSPDSQSLIDRVKELEIENAKLVRELQQADNYDIVDNRISELKEEIRCQQDLKQFDISQLQQRISELEKENKTIQDAFNNNHNEFMELAAHAKDIEKERDELKEGINWKEEYDQAVNEIGQLQDRLKEAEDEIRDLNRR